MIILNGANIDGNLRLSDQTPNRLVIVNASLDVVSGNGVIASDNLRASVMGTTGSGSLVFANGPVFGGIVQMAGFQLGTSATPGHVLTANASGVGTYQAIAALPAGTSGQTLRHDGTNWIANSNLFNDGTIVSLGRAIITGTPATDQPVFGAQFLSEAGWTSTGWTGSWGAGWSNNASNVSPLSQSTPAVVATSYQIAYIVTGRTAGSFTLSFGEQSRGGISATGAFGPTATTTAGLVITPTSDFNGTIVLSIRAITAVSAPAITGRASNSTTVFEARFNTGFANTFLGISAGGRNTIGSLNSAVGASALNNNTTGSWNSAVGVSALNNTTTGTGNSAVGINALNNNTTGSWNSAVGVNALNNNTTANWNSAVGLSALHNNTTGSWNSAVGVNAGSFIADGITANTVTNNSIYLGAGTRALANNQTNQIVIGNDAIGAGSNTVTLGNVNIVTTVLRGNVTGSRFTSTVVTGTAPLTVASTTLVTNLNADLVRGQVPAVVATVNTLMQRDANGRAQVAAPSVAADIARLDTVTAHTSLTNNPHAVTVDQIGAAAAIHTHGNITTAGAIGITANLPIITGAGGALQVGSFGVAANTFCQGNDARLSNQRMPLAHSFLDTGLHFVSGLTVGHVLKATGNDTFTFAALVDTDIPNLHPNKIIQNVSNRFVGDSQIANWNTAHSWGNHAGLYSSILHTHGHISNIGAITSTPVIPASGDCLLLTDATDGNSIRRSVPLGTGTNTFLRNDGAWAVPGGSGAAGSSDLVYSQAVNTNVQINSTTPQAVLSAPLENIAAGDIIEVEINGNILNNSGAVRTFIHSFTLGATTFDYTDGTTIAASASALATHNIRFRFAVIATNNIFFDGYVSRGEPNVAGTRQAIAATTVGHIFNTSANNETGNKNVVYLCRGQNATPTQTFQLRSYKVSVIKAKVMAVIPVTPTGLVVTEDNILRAFVTWNAVSGAESYPIQFRVNGGAATDAVAFNTWWESDAFTAGNLVEVRVAARNAAGTSTYSAWVGVTVTGIPKTPTDIRIVDLGNYAQVSWNSSQGATSYMVEHRVNDGTHMFTETIDTSWGSTWHNANDIVHARVAARNANGTSAYSGWVSVTLSGM